MPGMTPGGPSEETKEYTQTKPSNPFPPSPSIAGVSGGTTSNPFGGTPGGPSEIPKEKQPDSFERVFEKNQTPTDQDVPTGTAGFNNDWAEDPFAGAD